MVEGHLDRIAHLRDLGVQAANIRVGHVGNLGSEQLLDVLAHDAFKRDAGARVHDEGIPGAQVAVAQRSGQLQQSLRTTFGGDEHAIRTHHLEDRHHLAAAREVISGDGDHRVV